MNSFKKSVEVLITDVSRLDYIKIDNEKNRLFK